MKKKYRINEIKLDLRESEDKLIEKIAKKARIKTSDISDYELVRKSIDARKKSAIKFVYTIDFTCKKSLKLDLAPDRTYVWPKENLSKDKKIVVVGFGPAGIFAGLLLAQMGYKPLIIERGTDVDQRTVDVENFWAGGDFKAESNVQFGEGGAGAFSDGKLTTGISDPRIQKVLKELVSFGAPEEILYKHKPHIGTDLLKGVVKNIREEIINLGGQVLFSTKLVDIKLDEANKVESILVEKNGAREEMEVDHLILALGHSARDTFKMLYERKLSMEQKQFSMGVRIEHEQELINKAQYGNSSLAEILGPAEYKLSTKTQAGRGVYSFCMCPGGRVILSSSAPGQVLTNGMSYHARDEKFANAGILVDVRKEDFPSAHPLAGCELQETYEKKAYDLMGGYKIPQTTIADFKGSDLEKCLPDFVGQALLEALPVFGRRISGFDNPQTILKGPETRSSSPVRLLRDENFESSIKNIYPAGEGAGYAGGIMSAAVDGLRVAEKLIAKTDE